MALKIYAYPNSAYEYKDTVPFAVTFDGRVGGSVDKKVYIRNDHLYRWYENIQLQAVDTQDKNMVDGSNSGFAWKLAQSDLPLTQVSWARISPGNTLSLTDDLGDEDGGDVTSYIPVWIRVSVPNGLPIQTIKDIVIRITATENYIDG